MLPHPLSPSFTLSSFSSSLRHHLTSTSFRIPLSFALLGLINNILYVIILSAALDLVGPSLPKSLVLFFDVAPSFLLKLVAPFFIHRIGYEYRVWACVVMGMMGMGFVALGPSSVPVPGPGGAKAGLWEEGKGRVKGLFGVKEPVQTQPGAMEVATKLFGIGLASLSSGAGELSFLALTSVYGKGALAAWSSGTGAAGLIGAGAYVLVTTTLGWSVRASLVAFGFLPLGMLAAYFVVLPRGGLGVREGTVEGYAPVRGSEEPAPDGDEDAEEDARAETGLLAREREVGVVKRQSRLRANLRRSRALVLPYMLPLFLVYLSEYTINQGINPTLLYPLKETPFEHYRDFYPTYGALYQLGVFISRSSLPFIRIQALYIPAFLQWGNLVLLMLQAMYFTIIPSVWIVFAIIFWEGLLGGIVYVSTFRRIGEEVPPEEREFSLAATTVSDAAGICLASFLGMIVETT
ncbi:Protein BTN1 [Sphaceloma murrayae]|uniref:Protein BTN n=1 Tax=Sphaceloma murrayae TaxID=2082308 RepID=A0A2K1QP24_9PEZI|nr:Protein BTN1 [Sphaceloma murrayae]